jgi:Lanthionine synthetase C-like protein
LSRIDDAISKAQPDLLDRGLLTKTPCLCHGIPTNALAIVSDEKMLEYHSYMSTANLEGELGQQLDWTSEAGHSDDYAGLFTGEAGRAWVWALVDTKKTESGQGRFDIGRTVIGFDDV